MVLRATGIRLIALSTGENAQQQDEDAECQNQIAAGIGREINLADEKPGCGYHRGQPGNDTSWRGAYQVRLVIGLVIRLKACHGFMPDVQEPQTWRNIPMGIHETIVTDKVSHENT